MGSNEVTLARAKPCDADARPERRAHVAAFACRDTHRLGREVGVPLAVIAATGNPTRFAAWLSATRHAGWSPRSWDEWVLPFDDGLIRPDDLRYEQLAFDPRWLGERPLPRGVGLGDGSLVVDLPRGASAADLSAILKTGLADRSYDRVARRPDLMRWRYAARRPVVVPPLYALVTPGDITRVSPVDDLFMFRPNDLSALADAVALAVDALTLAAMARAASTRDGGERSHV